MSESVEWAFEDSKRHPIQKDYEVGRQLGEGKFSVVFFARNRKSGETVAIKRIDRENTNPDELVHEAMLMQMVEEHPGVVKIRDVYEDVSFFYLVMEFVAGGELFDKIVEFEHYSEREAAGIIKQVTNIVAYIHSKGVVHRDLKPENLLYTDSSLSQLKLCDFGLADTIEPDELLTAIVGSTTYMAPEVARGDGYDMSVDMYSIGVILYILLCGYPPFEPETGIVDLDFPKKDWSEISSSVIEIITRCLSKDSTERYTAVELLNHPWVKGQAPKTALGGTIKTMRKYNVARRTGETMRKKEEPVKGSVFGLFDSHGGDHKAPETPRNNGNSNGNSNGNNEPEEIKKGNSKPSKKELKEQKKREKEEKKKGGSGGKLQEAQSSVSFSEPYKDHRKQQSNGGTVSIEEMRRTYENQLKHLQKDLEQERKKVKSLEAQLAAERDKKSKVDTKKKK